MAFPIKREWIFSKTAGQLYFWAAILGFGYFIFFFAIAFSRVFLGSVPNGLFAFVFFHAFSWIGAFGFGTIWIGMLFCVIKFDRETIAGSFYLPLLLLFGPLAALIYYALRYRRLLKRDLERAATATTSA